MLERENLTSVPKVALGEESEFGKAVEDDARRVCRIDLVKDQLGCFAQFHLRRMKHREFLLWVQCDLRRYQLEDLDPIEGPPMPFRHKG